MSTLFSGHYLRNRSTLDIGVLGYISIVQHKEYSPEVLSLPPWTPCIHIPWIHKFITKTAECATSYKLHNYTHFLQSKIL